MEPRCGALAALPRPAQPRAQGSPLALLILRSERKSRPASIMWPEMVAEKETHQFSSSLN